jgi:hypothetical protein
MLLSLGNGVAAARRHDFAAHRRWMIRAWAVGIGVSSVRLVMAPLDLLLTPRGYAAGTIFVFAVIAGWALTLAAAELWIRWTSAAASQKSEGWHGHDALRIERSAS